MSSVSYWALGITALVLSPGIAWFVYANFRSPPKPTFAIDIPTGDSPYTVIVAVESPFREPLPETISANAVRCVSVGRPGTRVGLNLAPGRYWLYAASAVENLGPIHAVDVAWKAIKESRALALTADDRPIEIGPLAKQPITEPN